MGFRTKLDYSSNRQISQREKTDTILSGSTMFGLPFSGLTTGPNLNQSGYTDSFSNVISTFSGNSTTTIYTWFDPRMELGIGYLSAMTPSTSGITQYTGDIFVGSNYNIIDGNISYTDYSGVSFDVYSNYMVDLGGGSYSGTVQHFEGYFLSATSLDYSGRTIWIDNPEITRTDRLIITDNPVSGYVWTCIDSEGMGEWQYNGSSSGSTIWTAGTGTNSTVLGGSNGVASGITSVSEGTNTIAGGNYSHSEGSNTTASGDNSHAEGQATKAIGTASHAEGAYATASGNYSHAEGSGSKALSTYSHAEGFQSTASGTFGAHSEGSNTISSGSSAHAEGMTTVAGGQASHAEGYGTTASGSQSHSEGDSTIASGLSSHAEGGSTIAYGTASHAGGQSNISYGLNSFTHFRGNLVSGYNQMYGSSGDTSAILGGVEHKIHIDSTNSAIIGGSNNVVNPSVLRSIILGGSSISATTTDYVYVPNINIDKQDGLFTSKLGINTSSPTYPLDVRGSNVSRMYYSPTSPIGGVLTISATTGLPMIGANVNSGVVNQNGGISMGIRGWDDVTYDAYGRQGDTHIYSSKQANGLVLISSNGTGTEDYIECYVGGDAGGGGTAGELAIHMHGTGATKGYVGFDTNLPTQRLDVNGNGRFRSIGSSASAGALHYTADGTLTTNTSDERLKTNILTLNNALDKVKQLRGVTYNWTENPTGDTRIGFIAQEVNSIIPELTFINPNSSDLYMGVHYDNVTALLVEAVKELSNEFSSNTFLETQTILAEDNNIELNYNGTHESALDGGITIINGISENNNSYFKINSDGDFTTNVNLIPKGLVIPEYTPTSSSDTNGMNGNFTRDENYLYIKYNNTWKRANLENF
jgi:hypothetical protein